MLVEGPTDRQFVKYLANRTGSDLCESDISIIDTTGLRLMPNLIEFAKNFVSNLKAMCDGDLSTDSRSSFDKYRERFKEILEIDFDYTKNKEKAREILKEKNAIVLKSKQIEDLYCSPDVKEYLESNTLESEDKGWLQFKEFEYMNTFTIEKIKEYNTIYEIIDNLRKEMKITTQELTLVDLIKDSLQNEALEIHRLVYRSQLSKDDFEKIVSSNPLLKGYTVNFISYDNYSLKPKGISDFELRFNGPNISVYRLNPTKELLSGNV